MNSITISNYRNISYNNPIRFDINEGITFILGVNNIGKSNLLKFFYEIRNLVDINSNFPATLKFRNATPFSAIKNQQSNNQEIVVVIETDNYTHRLRLEPQSNLDSADIVIHRKSEGKGNSFIEAQVDLKIFTCLFNNAMYVGSERSYSLNSAKGYYDILVGTQFITTWDTWANNPSLPLRRKKIKELVRELKEILGFDHFEISVSDDKQHLLVDTDDGSFRLEELGSGISQFILVLGTALFNQPDFILIDEPETALHPKMQEIFVRALASKAKIGVIATSHSIGLARSTGDNIYSLNKDINNRLSLTKYGETRKQAVINTISELGYSQFVELGGNNILLVEGRTDIKCFKEILRKYKIEQHFIIMDLGGANFINENSRDELNELKRLNAKSYNVIFDSEAESENTELKEQFKKFKSMCEGLNFNVFATEYHSTDNYITQNALDAIQIGHTALGKFESLEKRDKKNKWGKSLNWKMFREMKKEDFEGTKLERFILDILIPLTL